jgi:hypothetical protein
VHRRPFHPQIRSRWPAFKYLICYD